MNNEIMSIPIDYATERLIFDDLHTIARKSNTSNANKSNPIII